MDAPELPGVATLLGRSLDDEAADILTHAMIIARGDWATDNDHRDQLQSRARLAVVKAVSAAQGAGLKQVDAETMLGALAQARLLPSPPIDP